MKTKKVGITEMLDLFADKLSVKDILSTKLAIQISSAIMAKRLYLNMSQKEFAEHFKIPESLIIKIEEGDTNLTLNKLAGIAAKLDMDVNLLMDNSDILSKLAEYEELKRQERLIKLPCKIGDIVYRICPKCNQKHDGSCEGCAWEFAAAKNGCNIYGLWKDGQYPPEKCTIVPYKVTWNYIPNLMEHWGTTVFLTKEEAQEKLREAVNHEKEIQNA